MPEEINRIVTDRISDFLFCPTSNAVNNLKKEGIFKNVHNVGDLMFEINLYIQQLNKEKKRVRVGKFSDQQFILLSIHRQESTSSLNKFLQLLEYTHEFSTQEKMKIFFPIHPRLKKWRKEIEKFKQILIMSPLSYLETQYLLSKCNYVFTDSGGLQKEAYFHKVLCVTLRHETEWIETIDNGWNRLWTNKNYKPQKIINEYGNGKTSKEILKYINI